MATKRSRLQFKFWLDVGKSDEFELAEQINRLKQGRAFSQVVRDGIRLMIDLWNGNLTVLLALFPWVEEAFYQRFLEQQPGPDRHISDQLARLEQLLLEQGNTPITSLPVAAATAAAGQGRGGPKPLAVPQVAAPVIEDDGEGLVVRKTRSDGKQSAQNFLESAFNLLG